MSFEAKTNDCGGTNADNGATGATCEAFVKVLNSSDFSLLLYEIIETQTASSDGFETFNLDFEITEAMVGHIYQSGFASLAGNYAPSSMFYDDVVVAAYTPEPTPAPTPAPSSNYAEDDFEAYTDDDETLSGWSFYVNVFGRNDDGSNGAYEYGLSLIHI